MAKVDFKRTNNEWVHMAPSPIHGKGLFARKNTPAGTWLVEYTGPRLSAAAGETLAVAGNAYVFQVNRREALDGSVSWNLARHANHSCSPNAESALRSGCVWLRALRPLAKGEEITYNYRFSFRDDPTLCSCRAPDCRGVMTSDRRRN